MKRISYLLMIILALGLISCGKDGSIGPAGPSGDKGDAGIVGAAGRDGSTILNGTSDPASAIGNVGDFYINTNSYVIFGPKTASGWESSKSILGAKGEKGDPGAANTKGDQGAVGPKGDKGDPGATGATGAKGDNGDQGVVGPKGDKGDPGAVGPKGDKGEADYVVLSGSIDPTNAIGNTGDFYFNTTTKTLFYRYDAAINPLGWDSIAKLSNTLQFSTTINMSQTDSQVHIDIDLPRTKMENSMLSVYVQSTITPTWYPLPGYVGNSNDEYRLAFHHLPSDSDKTRITIYRISGTGSFTNAKVRILVTEAEVFNSLSKTLDFKDYSKVSDYFKLNN